MAQPQKFNRRSLFNIFLISRLSSSFDGNVLEKKDNGKNFPAGLVFALTLTA